ncbi:3868_t:CDS:1 [Dentiscutata heterogama]|uniref:3868_t:CDS:1 n=1 Tax=Dentiscutata heterogama TaxID=1316150 RepID=A0ACA9L4W2_9GLOM|nr:3868_t:CDS:1 [Dentiscutata heterogama]
MSLSQFLKNLTQSLANDESNVVNIPKSLPFSAFAKAFLSFIFLKFFTKYPDINIESSFVDFFFVSNAFVSSSLFSSNNSICFTKSPKSKTSRADSVLDK